MFKKRGSDRISVKTEKSQTTEVAWDLTFSWKVEAHSQGFQKQKTLTLKSGFCTRGGTWTRTPKRAQDFKSGVSTDSTTRA